MIDRLDLNTKAQQLRELLKEDTDSPIDIFTLAGQIEKLTVVFYPLGASISGMCIKDGELKLIAVNSSMSYGRQRFSMAHEMFHLYYDDAAEFTICAKEFNPQSEKEKCADQFASYLLAPYKPLREAVERVCRGGHPGMPEIIALEQQFGMSHQAMIWRLISEKYLTRGEQEQFINGVIQEARRLGFDDRLYRPAPEELRRRTYGYYLKQVDEMRRKDLVSPGKIDELLLDAFRDDIAFGNDMETGGEIID
jgi:Zn-dependent peptidase ImmA (M78 family)